MLGAEGPLEFQGKRRTWGKKLGGKEGAENLPLSVDSAGVRVYSVHGHSAFWLKVREEIREEQEFGGRKWLHGFPYPAKQSHRPPPSAREQMALSVTITQPQN